MWRIHDLSAGLASVFLRERIVATRAHLDSDIWQPRIGSGRIWILFDEKLGLGHLDSSATKSSTRYGRI